MGGSLKWVMAMLLSSLSMVAPAHADEPIPGGEEQFKFMLGGILARIDSRIGVNGATTTGTEIDLGGSVGNRNTGSVVLGAQWRPGANHRISGTFFQTSRNRELSFDQTITIGDDTLVPPTTLETNSKNRFILATYEYSFVKNKDVEIAGLIGAYLNRFSADLSGTATVRNAGTTTSVMRTVSYRPAVTVPMPLIGASIDWYASPRVIVGASLSGLKAKIGDVDGSVYVVTAKAEYLITHNFGAGLAYMHTDANVDINKQSFVGNVRWKNDNILLYGTLRF